MKDRYAAAKDGLGGDKKEKTPAKELDHIRTFKGKSGGHIHEHHHTHPDHHPVEKHISANDAAMLAHMQSSMGAGAAPDGDPVNADPAAAAAAPAGGVPGTAPTAPAAPLAAAGPGA